ncbi:MAG TPA: AI-2E family transporter [Lysobacter sp.]
MLSRGEYAVRVVIALALAAALLLLWRISNFLLLGFGGIVFAVVIRAGARAVSRHLPIPMRYASALVVVLLLVAGVLLAMFLGDELASQVSALQQSLPELAMRVRERLQGTEPGRVILGMIGDAAGDARWGNMVVRGVSLLFSVMTDMLIVLAIALYLSFSPRSYRDGFLALVPARHRDTARDTLEDTTESLRKWLLGQLVSMAFVAVLTGVGLWLVGVPHALSLAILAGLLDFVPILGPFVAAVPGVLLAYAAGPTAALYAAGVYFIVQQLESAVILPLAQRWAVEMPPVIGLLAVVVFGAVFGVPGFLFGVPLTVVLMVLVRRFHVEPQDDAAAAAEAPGR